MEFTERRGHAAEQILGFRNGRQLRDIRTTYCWQPVLAQVELRP